MKKFKKRRQEDEYNALIDEISLIEGKYHTTLEDEDILEFLYEAARGIEDAASSYLENFFEHWLKWKYIPQLRTSSWIRTLDESLSRLKKLVDQNKSLRKALDKPDYLKKGDVFGPSLYFLSYEDALRYFEEESFEAIDDAKDIIDELEKYTNEDFSYLNYSMPEETPFSLEDLLSGKVIRDLGNLRENLKTNFNYR